MEHKSVPKLFQRILWGMKKKCPEVAGILKKGSAEKMGVMFE
jgi:hypothetical protein